MSICRTAATPEGRDAVCRLEEMPSRPSGHEDDLAKFPQVDIADKSASGQAGLSHLIDEDVHVHWLLARC